jgi:hypothetical protein
MRRAATTMVFLAACTSSEPPRPQGEQAPAMIEEPNSVSMKIEEKEEPAEPPLSLALSPVIEGECPQLDVSLLGGETFVHARPGQWIGRLMPDGNFEDWSLDIDGKYRGEPYYVEVGHVEAIEGAWPDEVFARYVQVDGRMWEGSRYLRRKDGGWHPLANQDEERKGGGAGRLFPWTGGNWLGKIDCREYDECKDNGLWLKVIRGPGKAPKFPELKGVEQGCWADYAMTTLPGGEIAAVGKFCHKRGEFEDGAWYGVFWSEAGGTKIERLPISDGHGKRPGPLVGVSPTRVVAAVLTGSHDAPALLFAYDGGGWKAMPPVEGGFAGLDVDAAGTAWLVAGGRLIRSAAGGAWEGVSFPTGPVRQVGGLRESVAYVTQEDGSLWLRPPGQEFQLASVAAPRFSTAAKFEIEAVRSAGREVWATAKYTEKGLGWPQKIWEPRRALLHNGPPREPQRCAQDESYSPEKGLVDWPPAAREDCATPFAVLVRVKSWTRKDNKFPEIGKLLKGKQEFAAAKFAEVELGGARIVGAAVPDVASGRALVELAAQNLRARPELVCAAPEVKRALPFDVASGKLVE